MKKTALFALLLAVSAVAAEHKPKLVLTIMIDQFRYDYLTRFRADYHGGFDRLLKEGAVFTNANYDHFPTITAVGHSTILTGAFPSISGIVANDWPDRETHKMHSSVQDDHTKQLGGNAGIVGVSPRRLLVSTVGDELKRSDHYTSKVIGISLKDRSAVLPAGHIANAAYYFDLDTGNMVTSDYYFPDGKVPSWVTAFNDRKIPGSYLGKNWNDEKGEAYVAVRATAGRTGNSDFERTRWGNDFLEQFAEAAIRGEKLGQSRSTDLLSVSFSSNDILGHGIGIDVPASRAMAIATDEAIGKLLTFVDRELGPGNTIVVLTADHGVSPTPAELQAHNMPGGYLPMGPVVQKIEAALNKRAAADGSVNEKWLISPATESIYLDHALLAKHNIPVDEACRIVAHAIEGSPHIFRVYAGPDLAAGRFRDDPIDRRVAHGYNVNESADVFVVAEPYYLLYAGTTGTSHGSPFNYDTHVPVIFMGPGIRAGRYGTAVRVNDIAPTLATMLDVEIPSGSVGRVLTEMMVQ